ncbi:hypothetical protein BDW_12725 [Bdellovibrio bacteriovorus W]|nr:hypothetical protein BDW_12725 [Bdellovibrio bacteriovorus W]
MSGALPFIFLGVLPLGLKMASFWTSKLKITIKDNV